MTVKCCINLRKRREIHALKTTQLDRRTWPHVPSGIYGQQSSLKVREKGRDLAQSYDKSPYTNRKIHVTTQKKIFDYTTITGVDKPVYGIPTFPLTAKAV